MNDSADVRVKLTAIKRENKELVGSNFIKLGTQLDCIRSETERYLQEREILKRKLGISSEIRNVMDYEKKLSENIQRNQEIVKEIKEKSKQIQVDSKRLNQNNDFSSPQIEACYMECK